jgi:hypothetical protein
MSSLPPPPQQPPPGYYVAPTEHPQGTTILVLGILSLVLCSLLGPFAWVMGSRARKEMDASGRVYSNAGNITAGWICGIISSALMILGVLALVAVVGLGAAAST